MPLTETEQSVPRRLVDEALERYIDWREACRAVTAAYGHWSGGAREERPLLFAAYTAALDREELAASRYSGVISQISPA
jgi:hypothetical protein